MATRNKPKRCDFVYQNKKYWFSEGHAVDISDSEDTTAYFIEATLLDYETDKEAPESLWEDEGFLEKHDKALNRIFPNIDSELNWHQFY
jgi:hypothetical protein